MQLTAEELVQLNALYAEANSSAPGTTGRYASVYQYIADLIESRNSFPVLWGIEFPLNHEVDVSKRWFQGAARANAGEGPFADIIRDYSSRQSELRYGEVVGEEMMQAASDRVAQRAINDDILEAGFIPTIDEIAEKDAVGVGEVLFARNPDDTASPVEPNGRNSAWSGAVLFSLLDSDQTDRLLSAGVPSEMDTLDDLKNVLFAVDSFYYAVKKAWDIYDITDIESIDWGILGDVILGFPNSLNDIFGAAFPDLAKVFLYEPNTILNMLKSAYAGQPQYDVTSENFVTEAHAFFSQFSAEIQQAQQIVMLDDFDSDELFALAKENTDLGLATRNALISLSGIALAGLDYSGRDLSLYDNASGEGSWTDAYLRDRATMLSTMMQADTDLIPDTDGQLNDVYTFSLLDKAVWEYGDLQSGQHVARVPLLPTQTRLVSFGSNTDDNLSGGGWDDRLYGGAGDDALNGSMGNDHLEGGAGNDTLIGGTGSDMLIGGTGTDIYIFSSDTLEGGDLDIIHDIDGDGLLQLNGEALDLSTLENNGGNVWSTEDASIRMTWDGVVSGSGDLLIALDRSSVTNYIKIKDFQNGTFGITLPDSEDLALPDITTSSTINGTSDDDNLSGTAANDAINGGGGNDSIDGLGGDDVIDAGAGDDGVDGGAGDDHIMGGDGEDSLLGNNGNDVIEGGAGFDWILGEAGDDMLFANAAEDYNTILDSDDVTPGTDNDLLVGSTGNNGLSGGEGNDRLYGGAGDDVLFGDQYWNARSTWSMTIEQNADSSISPVFVDAWTNTLGEPGPGGNDILIGGAGDDNKEVDCGSDILDGGIGDGLISNGGELIYNWRNGVTLRQGFSV
jgi:Ca2+-binding RTX toxin-like protein